MTVEIAGEIQDVRGLSRAEADLADVALASAGIAIMVVPEADYRAAPHHGGFIGDLRHQRTDLLRVVASAGGSNAIEEGVHGFSGGLGLVPGHRSQSIIG